MANDAIQLLEAARADLAKGYSVRAGTRFRQAADTGDSQAILEFAECVLESRIPGKNDEIRKRLEIISRPTASLARLRSGLRYGGSGGPTDKAGALSDLNASALQGHFLSALELATLYDEFGTEQASRAARDWRTYARTLSDSHGAKISQLVGPELESEIGKANVTPTPLAKWPFDAPLVRSRTILSNEPKIYTLRRLLSPFECAWLCEAAYPYLAASKIYDPATGTMRSDPTRTSDAMYFSPRNSSPLVLRVIGKILSSVGINPENAEPLAILRYQAGQEYKPHYDWLSGTSLMRDPLRQAGQRVSTVLVYLNNPAAGGHTIFPRLDLDVPPRQGDLLYFSNIDAGGQPARATLHAGTSVTKGEKWISSLWIREGRINS